jgi:hypothetical protein
MPHLIVWMAMSPKIRRRALAAAMLVSVLAATGCSAVRELRGGSEAASSQGESQTTTAQPKAETTVVPGTTAAQLALATSQALYQRASAVVLVGEDDQASLPEAASAAVRLGVPLLVTPRAAAAGASPTAGEDVRAELGRLAVRTVVPFGASATAWTREHSPATGDEPVTVATAGPHGVALPDVKASTPLTDLVVLALDQPSSGAAAATAKASGARVLVTAGVDPRADRNAVKFLAGKPAQHVLALGSAFGPPERVRYRIDTAASGVQLPGGGQLLFPGRRMVALYGHPGDPGLGSLGEQSVDAAIARARKVAASYQGLVKEPVVPAFEIIATVASSSAGPDGDYSAESAIGQLRPWVDAARRAGVYVVLDLQPGHTDFLTQAKRYTELLKQPHVGLALDPEWRLKPGQRHMVQIGSVTAAEINKTAEWLAALTRQHRLPQKVLMLHQFRLDMITNRATVRTDLDEVRVVIHADGFGTAGQKFDTWNAMHINAPRNVVWGWKNFYDEDLPTFTPRQTYAVKPAPVFVSYQ